MALSQNVNSGFFQLHSKVHVDWLKVFKIDSYFFLPDSTTTTLKQHSLIHKATLQTNQVLIQRYIFFTSRIVLFCCLPFHLTFRTEETKKDEKLTILFPLPTNRRTTFNGLFYKNRLLSGSIYKPLLVVPADLQCCVQCCVVVYIYSAVAALLYDK